MSNGIEFTDKYYWFVDCQYALEIQFSDGTNSHFIQWGDPRNDPIYRVGAWQIDFQYATKIVFENGVEMIFKGGKNPHNKVNDEGIDLVTFLNKYIENGYELPFTAVTDVEDILF